MRNLTAQQLYQACINHRFLMLRYAKDNSIIAVNCKIIRFKYLSKFKSIDQPTKFIGYIPCGFMEYISLKIPFLINNNKK